jgi:SDR family mycofactocin-dependent oxidoreductase
VRLCVDVPAHGSLSIRTSWIGGYPLLELHDKVAFVTGAARGQGRSHAVQLAQAGADIIAVDICRQIETVKYPLASAQDLRDTVEAVKATGRRIFAAQADVRDHASLTAALKDGVHHLGSLDVVVANAGICPLNAEPTQQEWSDVLDVNLTGVYNTIEASLPHMIEQQRGGSVILTGSTAGLLGIGGTTPGGRAYTAAKHGVVGLMRTYANYLAPHNIRVNCVHPTGVRTPMAVNDAIAGYLQTDPVMNSRQNALDVAMVEPIDISNAVVWLASEHSRYVTGVSLPVDAGSANHR